MQSARVLSSSSSSNRPWATRAGRLASLVLLVGGLAGLAPQAHADDFHTILGAGVGAVAGAAIGQHVGGHNGAILGAGAGGLVGASIANQGHTYQRHGPSASVHVSTGYPVTYYPQPVVAWQPPPTQYRYVQPVTYYQQPVVHWQAPPPQYWQREHRHHRGHDRGHHRGHGRGYGDHRD